MAESQDHPTVSDYLRDGNAIYERSFAIIRAEADLSRFSSAEAHVAVRMIHASGFVPLGDVIRFGHGFADVARAALSAGAPIFCDSEMVERGVTRARLPAGNDVVCTLRDPRTAAEAERLGTTRSAAAISFWGDRLAGSLVVIGNAPTALFHLLDAVAAGAPRPAAIIGAPVGFVGAAESKDALAESALAIPYVIVRGRLGGSAIAAAAVNALASDRL
nr:precorrin-8X methylmutase [Mesorhizobium sp. BR1-1-16]